MDWRFRKHGVLCVLLFILGMVLLIPVWKPYIRRHAPFIINRLRREATVADRIREFGLDAELRLAPEFSLRNLPYPPAEILLVGIKDEQMLHLYARGAKSPSERWERVKSYPFTANSGLLGPKLREGDQQIPEGLYLAESLNPNSCYHLSMRLNYPNHFDREKAQLDGRAFPGSDIFIHGDAASIGCVSIGNDAIEEVFVLADAVGLKNVQVIISPVDFRDRELPENLSLPQWSAELYDSLRHALP